MSYLEQIQVPPDHILFHQGDSSDTLYFVESGQVTVFLQLEGGQTRRLQTLGAGTIMGEIAFYLGTPHKTSAITDQPSKLYCLTTASLQIMQRENPQATSVFQEFVIRLLADRLSYAYEEIEELL
jgi:SulP family sulfate permease